jgi:hypothetical protein
MGMSVPFSLRGIGFGSNVAQQDGTGNAAKKEMGR